MASIRNSVYCLTVIEKHIIDKRRIKIETDLLLCAITFSDRIYCKMARQNR